MKYQRLGLSMLGHSPCWEAISGELRGWGLHMQAVAYSKAVQFEPWQTETAVHYEGSLFYPTERVSWWRV